MHDIDRTQLENSMEVRAIRIRRVRIFRRAARGIQRRRADGARRRAARGQGRAGAQPFSRKSDPESRRCARLRQSARLSDSNLAAILKSSARNAALQAVPVISDAIGSRIGGRLGPSIAKGLTAFGTSALGQEYEGVNQEDREFEGARQFVRLAADTVKNAVSAPTGADPRAVARSAFVKAARTSAPGLLQAGGISNPWLVPALRGQSGVWYRRGNKIVLQGA